jgi:hypothetical protein
MRRSKRNSEWTSTRILTQSKLNHAKNSGQRSASELHVAYLCGPEPENDLRVLAQHGVRIENVWAVDEDASAHDAALRSARAAFPALKIYRGSFNSFGRIVRERFDIVYLDFTAPIVSACPPLRDHPCCV